MNGLETLIDNFQKEQGWNNGTVLDILKNFLWDRRDKWQYKSMIADLESTLKEIARNENET